MSAIIRRGPFFLMLTWLLISTLAQAQPPTRASEPPTRGSFLSLQQAVELALERHPLVQEAGATLKAATARTEQARPTIRVWTRTSTQPPEPVD